MVRTIKKDGCALPLPAELLLPHRPPMLFVKSLLRRWDNRSSALAVLPLSGICLSKNRLLPEIFIELVAQAIAMVNGYDRLLEELPGNDGMLVGVDSFIFYGQAVPGRTIRIETEKTFEFGAVKIIHGELFDGEELLAAGDIKVWEDLG